MVIYIVSSATLPTSLATGCSVPAGTMSNAFDCLRYDQYYGGKSSSEKSTEIEQFIRSDGMPESGEIIVVAIDGTKEIRKHALEWALRNAVHVGDFIILLALIPQAHLIACSMWGLTGECSFSLKARTSLDLEGHIKHSCHQMLQDLHKLQGEKKVKVKVKVIEDGVRGIIASQAERMKATWVVLDRNLKREDKYCLERLQCNFVVIDHFEAKILRLNLKGISRCVGKSAGEKVSKKASSLVLGSYCQLPTVFRRFDGQETYSIKKGSYSSSTSDKSMQASSPGCEISPTSSDPEALLDVFSGPITSSCSSSTDSGSIITSMNFSRSGVISGTTYCVPSLEYGSKEVTSDSDNDNTSLVTEAPPRAFSPKSFPRIELSNIGNSFSASGRKKPPCYKVYQKLLSFSTYDSLRRISKSEAEQAQNFSEGDDEFRHHSDYSNLKDGVAVKLTEKTTMPNLLSFLTEKNEETLSPSTPRDFAINEFNKSSAQDQEITAFDLNVDIHKALDLECSSNLRKAMSLSERAPPGPPPLCSICQHKAPQFSRPPKRFSYAELQVATSGFSKANFLAEGGFGSVHQGVLPDGQAIAVKRLKLASSQGDNEFCAEVEILSCARQRNVVTLIGYCIEDRRRLLVYEFICNGSLDSHLYGNKKPPLEWQARHKIAVGTARGLRYLHEECREGCIIHRDMRPNNILLTHDFEPMVGDFGLARWQPDGLLGVQTRIIGTFGYLAPEYTQSGQITEKTDVYSFGVVLLELITGRKSVELSRPRGQQCLTEWARPLLDLHLHDELVDCRLRNDFNAYEMYCMLQVARLCLRPNPNLRPRMSQVLRMLEGDIVIDASGFSSSNSREYETFSASNILSEVVKLDPHSFHLPFQ